MNKEKIKKFVLGFIIVAALIFIVAGVFGNCLFIETECGLYKWFWARPGKQFSLMFTHSVQQTPVIENFVITDRRTLKLESTVYQSLGAGLPFLPEEGNFRQVGGKFIFTGMNREFGQIELRTGPEAELTLIYEGTPYYLYAALPYASLIKVRAEPWSAYLARRIFAPLTPNPAVQ